MIDWFFDLPSGVQASAIFSAVIILGSALVIVVEKAFAKLPRRKPPHDFDGGWSL